MPNTPDSGKIEATRSLALLCVFSYPQHANEWPIFQALPDFFPPVSGVLPLALEVGHIDTSNKYAPEVWIKHLGKKVKKDRKLKLPREVVPVLAEYVNEYKISDLLFPYTRQFLGSLLASIGARAGLKKQVSAHLLRDTCAVRLLKTGEPVEAVLRKLGLSETTWEDAKEKYLKLTSRAL